MREFHFTNIFNMITRIIRYIIGVPIIIIITAIGGFILPMIGPKMRGLVYSISRSTIENPINQSKLSVRKAIQIVPILGNLENPAYILAQNMNYIVYSSYVLFMFYIAGLIPFLIKDEWQLNTAYIVLALSVIYWIAFYLPKMEKPNIHVSYMGLPDTSLCNKHCDYIPIEAGKLNKICINIANVGLIYYKNCTLWVCFPEGFIILDQNDACYEALDYPKKFNIERNNRRCMFSPQDNDLSFAPFTSIYLPICVNIPNAIEASRPINLIVSASSESTWGFIDVTIPLVIDTVQ